MISTPIITNIPAMTGATTVGVGVAATSQNPPPLPQLPAGTVLNGVVTGLDQRGNPILQTPTMNLVISTRFPLPKNESISIRLEQELSKDMLPSVRILLVNGKAPPPEVAISDDPAVDMARPVGMLVSANSRPLEEIKNAASGQPQSATAKEAAAPTPSSQVNVSDKFASGLLLRPSPALPPSLLGLMQKILQLPQLPASTANPLPSGTQLHFKIIDIQQPSIEVAPNLMPEEPDASLPTAQIRTAMAAYGAQIPSSSIRQPLPGLMSPGMMATPPLPLPSAPTVPGQDATTDAMGVPQTTMPGTASTTPNTATPTAGTLSPSVMPGMNEVQGQAKRIQQLTPPIVNNLLAKLEATPLPQGQIAAVVLGHDMQGAVLAQTRFGIISLPELQMPNLPPASMITLGLQGINKNTSPSPVASDLPQEMQLSGSIAQALQAVSNGSAIDEMVSLLQTMQAGQAASMLHNILPQAGTNFSAGLMLFINMLRHGSPKEWLGDVSKTLNDAGRSDLASRLGDDFDAIRHVFMADSAPAQSYQPQAQQSWQTLFFPFMAENRLEHAKLYIRREDEENNARKKGGEGTRFVLEMNLSSFGEMQMDGLVKKREMKTSFDLVIRTQLTLPEDVQDNIIRIFNNTQMATGITGTLYFRSEYPFTLNPLEEMQSPEEPTGSIMA